MERITLFIFSKNQEALTAWGSDIVFNSKKWSKIYSQENGQAASITTCDAEHMREKLVDLGAKQESIRVVMFGIDKEIFS